MYYNGKPIRTDIHFRDHLKHKVPVQVYRGGEHLDIGFIQNYTRFFVRINNKDYSRKLCRFISRPGY
jgi:hypothetical protein